MNVTYVSLWPSFATIAKCAPLLPIQSRFGKIRQVLPFVAQYAKNEQKCLKMVYNGTAYPLMAKYDELLVSLPQYCLF